MADTREGASILAPYSGFSGVLKSENSKILGLTEVHTMIILGAGNLGLALAKYSKFSDFPKGRLYAGHTDMPSRQR